MTRGKELLVRGLLTFAVFALFVVALFASDYPWNFRPAFDRRHEFLEGLLSTLAVTAVAYVAGLAAGAGVALARMSRVLPVRHLGDLYVELIRGTPFLVQVWIAYFGVAPLLGVTNRFLIGTVSLGLFAAAYMGEIIRAGIESIERGQFEAARSLGLSRARALRHVVLPQAVKRMIPPLTSELIALTKESSLLFAIGVLELMSAARQVAGATYSSFEPYLIAAALYLVITVPLSFLARRLERRLGRSARALEHL